ncbi:hypothetical protein NDU88_008139 [Pleurodeles waltl]|uniref:Uncharacterized protein n=1 Tax=Pleurodeles waltl TaxID=8319 RepID=A0AAV7RSX6_PLEWA|nr:hypothetical protein NDU88_008139 [Pleurodeles waltl]
MAREHTMHGDTCSDIRQLLCLGPKPGVTVRASRETENSRPAHDPLPTERAWLEARTRVTGEPRMVRRWRPWNRLTSRGTGRSSPHRMPRPPGL